MQLHLFSQKGCTTDQNVWGICGKRGQRAFEMASLHLPVVPGFVIDSLTCMKLKDIDLGPLLQKALVAIAAEIGRTFGDKKNPLLLKVICSSNLTLPIYPTVFNVGLSPVTLPGFAKMVGDEEKAWFEYCYLLRSAASKLYDVDEEKLQAISNAYSKIGKNYEECAKEMRQLIGADKLPDNPMEQLERVIARAAKRYYDPDLDDVDNIAVMVQAMVFGHLDSQDMVGMYHTRDTITGEKKLSGYFQKHAYTLEKNESDIQKLDARYLEELQKIANLLEQRFHELREIKFIVEKAKLWLINQTSEDKKSTQAHLRTLLDLCQEGFIQEEWLIKQIPPGQLASLLHPVTDPASVCGLKKVQGGLAGSPGAAVGKVYFSAERLMEAHHDALQKGEDARLILCVVASFAEDVKAIEIGQGVIAVEGGYSSHAPVVARSMGKVAIVNSKIQITGSSFSIGAIQVKEGDYVTLDVPMYDAPSIYLGKAKLINPDVEENGLVEFVNITKKYLTKEFVVRANADLGRDAKVARKMGAYGIGLCRTEHMFFAEDRIMRFREMILAENRHERLEYLRDLQPVQRQDFYELFSIMAPYPVTIRLLDAPLHEFLPRSKEVFAEYCNYIKAKGKKVDKAELEDRIARLNEFNPMLGHRGCRVAITYPEIYEMQIRAILEAAIALQKEGQNIAPEIMIPLVMDVNELNMIRNGKRIEGKVIQGIGGIAEDIFAAEKLRIDYKVGAMVELPAAALLSGDLARYAEFFSYGTNDLTQTTNGLSRDDVNAFFPAYTEYDLLAHNPFQVLGKPVKELIQISASRARLTRPDIKLGLCGEHGADPMNIEFCREAGLQYVSCSSYSVPIAILAVAQANLS